MKFHRTFFVIPYLVPPIIPNEKHSMEGLTPRFELINQTVGRTVVAFHFLVIYQFRQDSVGKLFAQFHAPLVKAVNVEQHALYENFVFVHGNQRT